MHKRRSSVVAAILVFAATVLPGCGTSSDGNAGSTSDAGHADVDLSVDVRMAADASTDADTDADDAEAGADAGTDADAQAGADAGADADAQAGADAGADAATDPCGEVGTSFARCAANPLYTAGNAHQDGRLELFVADPSVMFDSDENLWKAWWQSPLEDNYLDPESRTAVLYAESRDGLAWTVQDAPAMTVGSDPDDWDFDRMETPSVVKVPTNPPERRYVMFYAGGNFAAVQTPFPGYPWYQIGVAFSADGRTFTRLPAAESPYAERDTPFERIDGLVLYGGDVFPDQPAVRDGLAADPEVVIVNGIWHLFFSSFGTDANRTPIAFGISHATSTDGIHWIPEMNNPVIPGQQPSVVWDGSRFEVFYNGDTDAQRALLPSAFNAIANVSFSYSTDGSGGNAFAPPTHVLSWDPTLGYERYSWLTGADVVLRDDGYWLYYTGFSDVSPPENFLVPANNAWCRNAIDVCTCYDDDGKEVCLLESVVTLNLARRTAPM
ncbi:MAG: hypothetical protein IPK13_09715 [Deltaproteobacteria bacterium]|nr:hypothetical protein [Deltaproteobacteria bacterium]